MLRQKTIKKLERYYHADPMSKARAYITFSLLKDENKNKKILDIGCGYGELLTMLKKTGFKNLFGIDISTECLRRCARAGIKNLKRIDIERQRIPYKKDSFDIIVATEVFEHLFDPQAVLDEIIRILKKDGYGLFSFPNELNIVARFRILFGGDIHDPAAVGSHIRFFKPKSIKHFLEKSGLKVDKMWGFYLERKTYRFFPGLPFLANKFPSLFARTIYVRVVKQ